MPREIKNRCLFLSNRIGADLGSKLMKMLDLSSQPEFALNRGIGVVVDARDLLGQWEVVNFDLQNVTAIGYVVWTNTSKRTWRIRILRISHAGTYTFNLVRVANPEGVRCTIAQFYDVSVNTYASGVYGQDIVLPPRWSIQIFVDAWSVAGLLSIESYRLEELSERA